MSCTVNITLYLHFLFNYSGKKSLIVKTTFTIQVSQMLVFCLCCRSNTICTSNNVDFFCQSNSRSRDILHGSILHLRPHVPADVVNLRQVKKNKWSG